MSERVLNAVRPTSNAEEITARQKNCLKLPIVQNSGSITVATLETFFGDPGNNSLLKERMARTLRTLETWANSQNLQKSLDQLTPDDMRTFLAGMKNDEIRRQHRPLLARVFDKLVEAGVLIKSPVPPPLPSHVIDETLPEIITRMGDDTVRTVREYVDNNRYRRRSKNTGYVYSHHLPALRRLANWLEDQCIFDLRDFSVADAREYIASRPSRSRRRNAEILLRPVFVCLVEAGLISANPFPHIVDDPVRKDETIARILKIARKTGRDFENALRDYLKNDKQTGLNSILNHFGSWLIETEGVHRLTDVTTDHLLRYRERGLVRLLPTSRRTYFSYAIGFFKILYEQKLLPNNPAAVFVPGNRLKYIMRPTDRSSEIDQIIFEAKSRIAKREGKSGDIGCPQNFESVDMQSMVFREKLMLAHVIQFLNQRKTATLLKPNASYLGQMQLGSADISPGESHWDLSTRIGVTYMSKAVRFLTPEFTERFNSKDRYLQEWASDLLCRHRRNVQLYGKHSSNVASRPVATACTSDGDKKVRCG